MSNEFGINLDRYPETGGKFWLLVDRREGGGQVTLRTASPSIPNALGGELARFNMRMLARDPLIACRIVDALNKEAT